MQIHEKLVHFPPVSAFFKEGTSSRTDNLFFLVFHMVSSFFIDCVVLNVAKNMFTPQKLLDEKFFLLQLVD